MSFGYAVKALKELGKDFLEEVRNDEKTRRKALEYLEKNK